MARLLGEALLKTTIAMASTLLAASASMAQTVNFDKDRAGGAPADWTCGVTGRGNPRWTVEPDPGAPSPPNVLMQSGAGDFPWCVRTGTAIVVEESKSDPTVTVKVILGLCRPAQPAGRPHPARVWPVCKQK